MAGRELSWKSFYVDPDIRKAETLPATAFTDPDYLEVELNTIFARTWLFVPQRSTLDLRDDPRSLTEMLRLRGSQSPLSMLDKPLFLQRDWKGKLHCFPNVCTHAWYPLVHGPGRERTIICAQHGRQFDCEGKFISQTGFRGDLENFPREADNLRDFPVEQWAQFLFVTLGEPVAPLHEFLGAPQESVASFPVAEFKHYPQPGEVREVDGNWKQHAWNYMDKFHITFIHRAPGGLADAIDLASYQTELYQFSALQWAYAKNQEHGFDPGHLPSRFHDPAHPSKRIFALWWFIFPNLTLNFYPWGLSVNVYMPVPSKPDKTLFLWYHYVFDGQKYEQKNDLWLNEQVDQEDIDAMVQVRRGVRSGFAPRGRFAPTEETGPHWFHRLAYEMTFGSNTPPSLRQGGHPSE